MTWRIGLNCILLALSTVVAAGAEPTQPRLVRVRLPAGLSVGSLLQAELDVVDVKGGDIKLLEWPGDDAKLRRLGIAGTVIDETPGRTLAARAQAELARLTPPPSRRVKSAIERDGIFRTYMLPPFGSGSMAGFWTTAEIKMKLDELVANDANDVVADQIDTLGTTWQGRPVWGLKLGKSVVGPDPRPVAFFNALTHAREPQGMQTLFYFVDDLLAGYGVDPFSTYLLDHRVIYIVPLVNPDGYVANENTYFGSGGSSFGYWRKNARDNNGNLTFDSGDGVDLNRNYAYKWGLDDSGSSPTPTAETYRGPAAFSEPETQAQRDIVIALDPKTGFSFHTYSDLMLHPWGHTTTPTLDHAAFKEWSDELTRDNAYISGVAPSILYSVNGEFNDWCYGDTLVKPRMFSWTPEVGADTDDFWPAPSRIVPLAKENVRSCYVIAAIAGPFVQEGGLEIAEGAMNIGNLTHVSVRARNLGASSTAGPGLTGTLSVLDAGASVGRAVVSYPTLGTRQTGLPALPFQIVAHDTLTPGRLIRFQVEFNDDAGLVSRDTIAIPAGTPTVVAFDDASSGLTKWSAGSWGIVTTDPDHPSRYFADSPAGSYAANADNVMRLLATLNLSTGVHAYAVFESRWEMEPDYDAGAIEASLNGVTWTRVASTGTTPGSGLSSFQPAGQPVFAGSRRNWRNERANLSAFTGASASAVRLRFHFQADGGNPYNRPFDGYNFDSLRIELYDPAAQPVPVSVDRGRTPNLLELAPPAPNPVSGLARFAFALPVSGPAGLVILDVQGRHVRTLFDGTLAAGHYVRGWDLRDDRGRKAAPGVYLALVRTTAGAESRRFVVVK